MTPLQRVDVARRHRDDCGGVGGRVPLHPLRKPAAHPVLEAGPQPRRPLGIVAVAGVVKIEHVGNAGEASPQRAEQEQRELRGRDIDEVEPLRRENSQAASRHRQQCAPSDGAEASSPEEPRQKLADMMCRDVRREERRAVVVATGCGLKAHVGRENFHLPAELRQLPGEMPRAVHVGDHRRRIGAGDDQDAGHSGFSART
jgi:hypothetical protein